MRNGLQLAGGACVFVGLWMVFPPAALVAVGGGLILLERGLARGDTDDS